MGRNNSTTSIRRSRYRLAAIGITAALAVAACGGDDDGTESAAAEAADAPVATDASGADEIRSGDSQPIELPDQPGRDLIHNLSLTLQTSDVGDTAGTIRGLASETGGFVTSSSVTIEDPRDDGSVPGGGNLVVRMDPSDVSDFVASLDGAGFVTQLSQQADDVTTQLVDLDIRIRQAEISVERVEALLEAAVELDDVFSIERELTSRQTVLEQLRAQQRTTDDLVALATVSINIQYRTPDAIEDAQDGSDGITDGLSRGWSAFVGTVFAIGYVLALTAPFLLVIALITAAGVLVGRRLRQRQAIRREEARRAADRMGTPPPPVVSDDVPSLQE